MHLENSRASKIANNMGLFGNFGLSREKSRDSKKLCPEFPGSEIVPGIPNTTVYATYHYSLYEPRHFDSEKVFPHHDILK